MNIRTELFALAERVATALSLPAIGTALITAPRPSPARDAEFGLVALADGCAGLYYAWLGETQADMPARFLVDGLLGKPALDLARYALGDDDGTRSVGIAAINAITEHVYRRADFAPPAAPDSFAGLRFAPGSSDRAIEDPALDLDLSCRHAMTTFFSVQHHLLDRACAAQCRRPPWCP